MDKIFNINFIQDSHYVFFVRYIINTKIFTLILLLTLLQYTTTIFLRFHEQPPRDEKSASFVRFEMKSDFLQNLV